MSSNHKHVRDGAAEAKKRVVELEKRGRYDQWNRNQSDHFRQVVVKALELRSGQTLDLSSGPYSLLTALKSADWSNGCDLQNLALEQTIALFKKDEDLRSPIDKEQVAFEAFLLSEAGCKRINDAILNNQFAVTDGDAARILFYAQRKIADILGEAPKIRDLQPSFGPGAVVTTKKKTSARHKLSVPPSISRCSLGLLFQMSKGVLRWHDAFGYRTDVVAAELRFVTKNYKTDRAIVLPTSLTGMYQRALGRFMKERALRNEGIDLFGGQQRQRELARISSLTGENATVDLKGASDSIAHMLVAELFPLPWFELFDQLRDDRVKYRDTVIELEKISSMGCGFTFELETILFYALAYGIARCFDIPIHRKSISVYGDDIIVPTALARKIVDWFPYFGFQLNVEKTFIDGPFRESCGGDYVSGLDVRPFFIRNRMTHHTLVCFYNHLMRKPHQDPEKQLRALILSFIPPQFQNFGPDGFGDGHLISGANLLTYATAHKRKSHGYGGYIFETYVEIPKRDKQPVFGDVIYPSYSIALRRELAEVVQVKYPWATQLRSLYFDAFVRAVLEEEGSPLDHFVLRKERGARVKAKKVRVYVLGPGATPA